MIYIGCDGVEVGPINAMVLLHKYVEEGGVIYVDDGSFENIYSLGFNVGNYMSSKDGYELDVDDFILNEHSAIRELFRRGIQWNT